HDPDHGADSGGEPPVALARIRHTGILHQKDEPVEIVTGETITGNGLGGKTRPTPRPVLSSKEPAMLHDNNPPELDPTSGPPAEIEPISPREAERILAQALEPYLSEGWRVLDRDAYTARLTRENRILDV